jgi:signal transduction histidine kinase
MLIRNYFLVWVVIIVAVFTMSLAGSVSVPLAAQTRAIDSLKLLLRSSASLPDSQRVALLNALSFEFHAQSPDSARFYGQQARTLAESTGNKAGYAKAQNYIGNSYYMQGNYDQAMRFYLDALDRREQLGDSVGVAGSLNNVGLVYAAQRSYSQALSYYVRAAALNERLGNKLFLGRNFNNIAQVYEQLGKLDSALLYNHRSLEVKRALGDKAGEAVSLSSIGTIDAQLGHFEAALRSLGAALRLHEELKQYAEAAKTLNAIGDVALKQENTTLAAQSYRQALNVAQSSHIRPQERAAYKGLAECAERTGNFRQAYEFHKQYFAVHDSIFNESTRKQIEELQVKYDVSKKEAQISVLQKENALQAAQRKFFIAGGVLLAVILLALSVAYRIRKCSGAEIARQKTLAENRAVEVERMNTELHANNEELQRINKELENANSFKIKMLSVVSHDLKNPLGTIIGFAEMIMMETPISSTLHEFAARINETGWRMIHLTQDLLDGAARDLRQIHVRHNTVEFTSIVSDVVREYQHRAAEKQQIISFTEPTTLVVAGDAERLRQVVENVVSNAVKYAPVATHITVTVEHRHSCVRLSVRDEGPGLSEHDKQHAFQFFQRLSAQPTGGENSTGVGLAIVKHIVELHNGRVWIESERDKGIQGATFVVELPAASEEHIH